MLRFTKLEGCGNDFLIVDARTGSEVDNSAADIAKLDGKAAEILCDRRFGVGGDGVLLVGDASASGAVARMRVLNADGSEAEMCGNGIRCVTKYLFERDQKLRQPELAIETGAGVLTCAVTLDPSRHVSHVTVEMGQPRLERERIPMTSDAPASAGRVVDQEIQLGDRRFRFSAVSMGNPHAVIFVDGDEPLRALAEKYGPLLEHHAWFPRRTNAEFARLHASGEIELVVWERGCGITLACGTGACGTAVAAVLTKRIAAGQEVPVRLLGGTLHITVAEGLTGVRMRGPAQEVYEAELDLGGLLRRHTTVGKG